MTTLPSSTRYDHCERQMRNIVFARQSATGNHSKKAAGKVSPTVILGQYGRTKWGTKTVYEM